MEEILKFAGEVSDKIGVVALLISFLWALDREKVVTGSQYRQALERAERAEERAEKLESTVELMTTTFSHQVDTNERTSKVLASLVSREREGK
jgi:hypothetical protein